jgi:ketosteroid isomerase-like protein
MDAEFARSEILSRMSQENVELVRRWLDAGNRADLDAWLSGFAPDAEWHTSGRFADRGVYRGREGLTRYWAETREDIDELRTSASEIRAMGDKVFVAVTLTGRGRRSMARFEERAWLVVTCCDGRVERVEAYLDPDEALEAAGLRGVARDYRLDKKP